MYDFNLDEMEVVYRYETTEASQLELELEILVQELLD